MKRRREKMTIARQKMMALNGDEAVAFAAKQSDVDVVAAYPITPQTIIVERFSEYVANGEVDSMATAAIATPYRPILKSAAPPDI